ncbi:apoptosis facilitator Bcl-2-like protein 14 isoform X2 [Sander lucioperca]|uniref:apoptosis facilitator Bcl-2-like protein 14 isoform X2 n=1 Tax=Sander lucioperca TaxID=283035 RepID=UPI0016534537|nr:apoptosis facilitator Bcl-2-like protein 14 isoform X2 [Sander lucioperca]
MANGHVEIHDPFSNPNSLHSSTRCGPKSTSDTDSMADTVEFRLLMAYAKRRRPEKESSTHDTPTSLSSGTDANGSSPQTPAMTKKEEKRKKKRKKGWKSIFSCIKPQTGAEEPSPMNANQPDVDDRCGDVDDRCGDVFFIPQVEGEDELKDLAGKLTNIADEIPFIPPEIETDSPTDVNVEKTIGLLLRESGDRLNEKELKDAAIATELFWDYSFFKLLMTTLLTRMGLRTPNPDSPGPKASPKSQIAVTCEVTSRLSALNTLPSNRLLDHGARYLQHYYSSWAQQQGGYEEAFYSDDEDDIQ